MSPKPASSAMRRRAAGALALLLSLATVTRPAIAFAAAPSVAAPSARSGGDRDAKSFYDDALAAYREGRFRDAIAAFAEADRLLPRAALSYNIAKAHERLNDVAGALRYFRDYLRRAPNAENARQVRHRIAELERLLSEKQLQQLSVFSEPPGAMLSVDGKELGVTPWTGELEPGQHRLELRSTNGIEQALDIELLREHAMDIRLRLAPIPARVATRASAETVRADSPAEPSPAKRFRTAEAPTANAERSGASPAVLIAGGALTLAGLGAGIGFELAAQREDTALERYRAELGDSACAAPARPPECEAIQRAANRFDRDRSLSIAGFATAVVATVGTVGYWLWAGAKPAHRSSGRVKPPLAVHVDASVSANGSIVTLSGRF